MHDIVVVGAGPVGLYAAKLLEKKLNVLILEKNKDLGDKACSGLYSTNLKEFLDIKKSWVEHKVKGAVIHSHSHEIVIKKPKLAAYVVNRKAFTKSLAKQVKSKILLGTSVKKIVRTNTGFKIQTNKGLFESKFLLGCDGVASVVARNFGVKPREIVTGLIAKIKNKDMKGFVELWYDKNLTNDGFFWRIPRGRETEYGCLGKDVNFKKLEKFFSLKAYKKEAAPIPTGPCKTYFLGCLLLGDAAGITKPWSFGGIIYGFTCAKIASEVIFKAFKEKNFSEEFLEAYEKKWQKKLGKSITLGLMFREFYKELNNKQIDKIFEKLQSAKTTRFEKMDMDFPFLGLL